MDFPKIPGMHRLPDEPPPGNHINSGPTMYLRGRGRFGSSPPSRQSPARSNRSSPLSAPPSVTPRRRREKSPVPETTPTRLRQEISMTTGASPSILGTQRSRKAVTLTDVPGNSITAISEISALIEAPEDVPTITVNPAFTISSTNVPQTYGEPPPNRHFQQMGDYHSHMAKPSYPRGPAPPSRYSPYDPYYQPPPSAYPTGAGLAPPAQSYMPLPAAGDFMRTPSPGGGWQPQALESVFPESEISSPSDWVASDTGTAGHGRPGDRETRIPTPALSRRPPLPQPPALPLQASTPSIFAETPAHLPCIPPASSDTIQSTPEPPQPETHANRTVTPLSETHEGRTISPKSDTASSPGASPKPSRGAGGRPTTKALGLIESAFEQIALIIEGLVESTGKPASDLYRRFERSRKGPSTSQFWNVYTHYFANNEKEESKRVPGPPARTQDFRSRCYTQYKLAHPNYRELLETYRELEMASVEMTVGQRKKEIEKYEKKLRDLAMEAHRTLDVDTFFLTAGSIVLSDHGLVDFFETPNAVGFLSDKTDIQPNEALAAFSAHIFNQKAMESTAFAQGGNPTSPIVKAERRLPSVPLGDATSQPWLTIIKQALSDMFMVFDIILSMTQFPWKLLLLLLAKNGMVLSGYPPILMPGEIRGTNKTKAIADLVSTEQLALATALGANGPTKYRIRLRRVAKDKIDDLQSGRIPVIIGQPPLAGSTHARGHQAYYDMANKEPVYRWDGLPCLTNTSSNSGGAEDDHDVVIIESSPPNPKATRALSSLDTTDNTSNVGQTAASKASARTSAKRKISINSPSSDDDDLYEDDPKHKRLKGGLTGKRKEADDKVTGKGKGKGKEKIQRGRKSIKSVAILDNTESSEEDVPPERPKPRPAYQGAPKAQTVQQSSSDKVPLVPKSPPQIAKVLTGKASHSGPTSCEPAGPARHEPDGHQDGHAPPRYPAAVGVDPQPSPFPSALPGHDSAHPMGEGLYAPQEARPPPLGYTTNHYHHAGSPAMSIGNHPYGARPPMGSYQPALMRYPSEGDGRADQYSFRNDFYGYGPAREYGPPPREYGREYYGAPYPHTVQSYPTAYSLPPPAPGYTHQRHDDPQQPNAAGPGGPTINAMASSSRLSPQQHHPALLQRDSAGPRGPSGNT